MLNASLTLVPQFSLFKVFESYDEQAPAYASELIVLDPLVDNPDEDYVELAAGMSLIIRGGRAGYVSFSQDVDRSRDRWVANLGARLEF